MPNNIPDPLFDALDAQDPGHRERMERFEKLHELWRDVPAEEILHDLNLATQMVMFRLRQERLLLEAKIGVAHGATHECSEWIGPHENCLLCGKMVRL